MYTRRSVRLVLILKFGWWIVLVSAIWATAVVGIHEWMATRGIDCSMPIAPLGTIGVAVAFLRGLQKQPVV